MVARRKKKANPPSGAASHVQVIRVVDRTSHSSPRERRREIEFQVANPTGEDLRLLYVPLAKFCPGLRVNDVDGQRLLILPNRIVEEELETLKQEEPEHYELLDHQTRGSKYKMLVLLPMDRPLRAGSTRIITIRFEEEDPVRSKWKTPFSVPIFHWEQAKHVGQDHDHMMELEAPPGFVICGKSHVVGPKPTENELHDADLSGKARFTSARLPPAESGDYRWVADYELVTTRRLTASILHLFLWASLTAAIIFGWLALARPEEYREVGRAVTAAFAGATIAMVYGIRDEWAERLKGLMAVPLLIHLAAWGLFSST